MLLSICIPAYNRPSQLNDLLTSIDCASEEIEIEIVIVEDCSQKQREIRKVVAEFSRNVGFLVRYYENDKNLGFDGNLRRLMEVAQGDFVLYIGDDDLFLPGAISKYLKFLRTNKNFKYVLRNRILVQEDGRVHEFNYFRSDKIMPAGVEQSSWLFKRSVSIGGFTISRTEALKYATSDLDGTLLYQVYLMAQVCLRNPSIYCSIPLVQSAHRQRKGAPGFGSSDAERGKYTSGEITLDNSINFTKSYLEVTRYLDARNATDLTHRVATSLSKYSYPFLSIQRNRGLSDFLKYARRLETECGLGQTIYFHIYKWSLAIFGERLCTRVIIYMKRRLGHTPDI